MDRPRGGELPGRGFAGLVALLALGCTDPAGNKDDTAGDGTPGSALPLPEDCSALPSGDGVRLGPEDTATLRETLGTLAVKPLVPARSPVEIMTAWLAGTRPPNSLSLGQHCDLRDPLHQANMVRCRAQELATKEVRNHLEAGKTVASLGLEWSGRLQFVLAEDLSLSAIKYLDVRERDGGYEGEGDAEQLARLDADFVLMSMELDKLVTDLLEVFGSAE